MSNHTTTPCDLWRDQPSRCNVVAIVEKICPSLSIACCFLLILIIWLFKKYQLFVQRIILALSVSALFQSITFLVGSTRWKENNTVCRIQAFALIYFSWSTLSWVIVITVNMLLIIKGRKFKRLEIKYHCFVWFNALIWACFPFIKLGYGTAGIWCWIKKDEPYLRFGVWYVPLLAICIWLLCIYVYIFIHNRRLARTATGTLSMSVGNYKKEVKPLLIYPIIYLLLTIPVFLYRLYDAYMPDKEPLFGLVLAAVLSAPSVGSCMAIVYAFHNESLYAVTWGKFRYAFSSRFSDKKFTVRPYSVSSYRGSVKSHAQNKNEAIPPENDRSQFQGASFHTMSTEAHNALVTRGSIDETVDMIIDDNQMDEQGKFK